MTVSTLRGERRPSAQGDRQADRVREGRAAARRRQHSVHAADQPGGAAQARARLPGRGHAAGRGSVSRRRCRSRTAPKRSNWCARRWPTSICSSPSASTTRASCATTCGFRNRRCASRTLGVNTSDLTSVDDRGSRRGSVHDRLLRAHRAGEGPAQPRRGVSACCARQGTAAVAAGRRRLPAARAQAVSRGASPRACARPGLGDEFVVSRRRRSREEGAVLSRHRRAVGAERLSRAEGPLSARSDGVRRAGGAAESRRVPGDHRAHRRRRAVAIRNRGADVADAIYELWKDPARAAALGRRRRRGRAPPLHRAAHGQPAC